MQRIQNKNIKFITAFDNNYNINMTIEQKHLMLKLETFNTRLYERKLKTWEKFAEKETEIYNHSQRETNTPFLTHPWWPNTAMSCLEPPPIPRYV